MRKSKRPAKGAANCKAPQAPRRPTPRLLTSDEVRGNQVVISVGDEAVTVVASPLPVSTAEMIKALILGLERGGAENDTGFGTDVSFGFCLENLG